MKYLVLVFAFVSFTAFSQNEKKEKKEKTQIVEASCGQCKFGLTGNGCDLAVKVEGKAYWVKGTDIHSHGGAHSEGGFCNTVRKAEVIGEVKEDKFVVSHFKLLPIEKK